jgi:hypothetical protein
MPTLRLAHGQIGQCPRCGAGVNTRKQTIKHQAGTFERKLDGAHETVEFLIYCQATSGSFRLIITRRQDPDRRTEAKH